MLKTTACSDAEAVLAAAQIAVRAAEATLEGTRAQVGISQGAYADLRARQNPAATPEELAGAKAVADVALATNDIAVASRNAAQAVLTAAETAKETACATGPKNPDLAEPLPRNPPIIAMPDSDVEFGLVPDEGLRLAPDEGFNGDFE